MPSSSRWRPPIQVVPLPYLMAVPVALAVATIVTLFAHSDTNAAMIWSQCHAHARIPGLSRLPGVGTPMCYMVSFFSEALAALRSRVVVAVILAFVGGLLSVSMVEAARICNAPNVLIAYPTGPWLVFNLVGGAVVWELVIIPAFLHRAKSLYLTQKASVDELSGDEALDAQVHKGERHLSDTEVIAIPASVLLGYYVPSVLMLVFHNPVTIGIWLFFPVYVSIIRQLARRLVQRVRRSEPASLHIESSRISLLCVYVIPVLCSLLAHALVIWHLAVMPDDRKEMTRSTVRFVEIDIQFIAWTVLYWMFVEVGWKVPLITIVASVIGGPGAGICSGWMYREKLIHHGVHLVEAPEDEESAPDEESPLLG